MASTGSQADFRYSPLPSINNVLALATITLALLTAVLVIIAIRAEINLGYQGVLLLFAGMTGMASFMALQRTLDLAAFNRETLLRHDLEKSIRLIVEISQTAANPEFQSELNALLNQPYRPEKDSYEPWQLTAKELVEHDSNLALARLRMDLEAELRRIAETSHLPTSRRWIGALALSRSLVEQGILSEALLPVLSRILDISNRAVHGQEIEPRLAMDVVVVGSQVLEALRRLPTAADQDLAGE